MSEQTSKEVVHTNGELLPVEAEESSSCKSVGEVSSVSASELTSAEISSLSMLEEEHETVSIAVGASKAQEQRGESRRAHELFSQDKDKENAVNKSTEAGGEDGGRHGAAADEGLSFTTTSMSHQDAVNTAEKDNSRRTPENGGVGGATGGAREGQEVVVGRDKLEPLNREERKETADSVGEEKEGDISEEEHRTEVKNSESAGTTSSAAKVLDEFGDTNNSKEFGEVVKVATSSLSSKTATELSEPCQVTLQPNSKSDDVEHSSSYKRETQTSDSKSEGNSCVTSSSEDTKSEWVDILGSGELLKKVSPMVKCLALFAAIFFICWRASKVSWTLKNS